MRTITALEELHDPALRRYVCYWADGFDAKALGSTTIEGIDKFTLDHGYDEDEQRSIFELATGQSVDLTDGFQIHHVMRVNDDESRRDI